MIRRFLPCTALALTISACATSTGPTEPRIVSSPAVAAPNVPERLRVRVAGRVVSVALEDYVTGAVLSEVTPLGETPDVAARIYEVQSVVARTYAAAHVGRHRAEGFDFCDSTHCQLYEPGRRKTSRFAAVAERATLATRGQILTFGSHVAEALFHSDCGGSTASAADVWGGPAVPYLRAMVDDVPAPAHRQWTVAATADELRAALNADPRTSVGRTLGAIDILDRDGSGRAAGLGVRGERSYLVKGDVLRAVINRALGDRAIQSTRFTVERQGNRFVFAGSGFGHGVGLCQRGAMARARRGEQPGAILTVYYPGARLIQAGRPRP